MAILGTCTFEILIFAQFFPVLTALFIKGLRYLEVFCGFVEGALRLIACNLTPLPQPQGCKALAFASSIESKYTTIIMSQFQFVNCPALCLFILENYFNLSQMS